MKSLKFSVCSLICALASGLLAAADAVPPAISPPLAAAPLLPTVSVELDGRAVSAGIENLSNPLVVMSTNGGDVLLELLPAEAPETVANFLGLAEGTKAFLDPTTGRQERRPFYDGLVFHRVIDRFIVQSGSPAATSNGGPGYAFDDEINADSLGLGQMQVLDDAGYPNPVLGIRTEEDFQQRVLKPLYAQMGITSRASLDARLIEVEQRLLTMTVKQANELLGYRYTDSVLSRAPLRGVIAMANSGPDSNGSQFFITLADSPWLTGKHTVFGKVRAGLEILDAIGKVRVNAANRPLQDVTIISMRRVGSTAATSVSSQ